MAKGSQFERDIARKISLWWSDGAADDWFWRVGGSGGRATQRAKRGKTTEGQCGDIVATCPEGLSLTKLVTFELKRGYNAASIQDLFDKPDGPGTVKSFLEQVTAAAKNANTPYWALIWKRDRRKELVLTNHWHGIWADPKASLTLNEDTLIKVFSLEQFFTPQFKAAILEHKA